jgi:membrane peptidoglycan carboxypeptidase
MKWKAFNKLIAILLKIVASALINFNFLGFKKDINKIIKAHQGRNQWASSNYFIEMLVVGEDRRFYEHGGVDLCGITRAIWIRIKDGSVQGASTIEQQLVRVVTGRYTVELSRKTREILLSSYLGTIMSKNEVASLYLDIAYFGEGMHGLDAACKKLGIQKTSASLTNAARLVARLKYPEPSIRNTFKTDKINRRVKYIRNQYLDLNGECNNLLKSNDIYNRPPKRSQHPTPQQCHRLIKPGI